MGFQLNEDRWNELTLSVNTASVGANTTVERTFTVPGLRVGDFVMVNKPSHQAGLFIANARVSANDTLAIQFGNNTGAGITPTVETYLVYALRTEKTYTRFTA
jgi:hypothetical protein